MVLFLITDGDIMLEKRGDITPQTPLPVDVDSPDAGLMETAKAASVNEFDKDLPKRTQDSIVERLATAAKRVD